MKVRFKSGIRMLALTGALALACQASAEDTVKIAVAGPHTGGYAAYGEQFWRGSNAAADAINAAGGIDGKQIELIKADDACEPKQAVSVANRLVDQEEVDAVVGHFCSSSSMPASEIYADGDVLMVTVSSSPQITERDLPNIIRIGGRDDQQGPLAADFIIDQLKAQKVAVIHDKDTFGQGVADAARARLKERGVEEVMYEGLTRGEKDFNALVTKIKASGADAVYYGGCHAEAGPLIRQMREQGLDAPLVSDDCVMSEDMVTSAGGPQFTKGMYATFGRDARNIPESQEIVEAFRKEGFEPVGYTLYAYASVQSIAEALKAVGNSDGEALAEWLKANGATTVMGPKAWDSKGDLKTSDYVMYVWAEDGSFNEVSQ